MKAGLCGRFEYASIIVRAIFSGLIRRDVSVEFRTRIASSDLMSLGKNAITH
jgi:hypothetical protein